MALFAPIPKIRSDMVTESELRMVVLPLNVMLPKNSASLADMTYLPVPVTYTGDFSRKPSRPTMGTYLFTGSARPITEMFEPTMRFEVVIKPAVAFVN